MQCISYYQSPLGRILLSSDDTGLSGLWFEGQRYFARNLDVDAVERETEILKDAKRWLDVYFSGHEPEFSIPLHIQGSPFHKEVSRIMCSIPYGEVMTYGEIAEMIRTLFGVPHMSARAVGGAVGHNEISIIVPCHRVVGSNGNLTGYGGGMERKMKLLELEGVDLSHFYVPRRS